MMTTLCLLCHHYAKEASVVLQELDEAEYDVKFFPPYCGRPPLADGQVRAMGSAYEDVILFGGECLNEVIATENWPHLHRFDNCFQLAASQGVIDYFIRQGAYLMTPGWLQKWRQAIDTWGFAQEEAQAFFGESCYKFVLLDTGVYEDTAVHLAQFRGYINMPVETVEVGLDHFRNQLKSSLYEYQLAAQAAEVKQMTQVKTDYAMAIDLLQELTTTFKKNNVVKSVCELFDMLFAPRSLYFLLLGEAGEHRLYSGDGRVHHDDKITRRLLQVEEAYQTREDGDGFTLQLITNRQVVGVIEVADLLFPQYQAHYLNIALQIKDLCALAISNTMAHQTVLQQRDALAQQSAALQEALAEKEILLQEIHHRVKNNLQTVSGLLYKQQQYVADEGARGVLDDSISRVKAMALIHEKIYRSESLARVNLAEYIREFARQLFRTYKQQGQMVSLHVAATAVHLSIDRTIPVALILNELITNALKYAFPDDRGGDVWVDCTEDAGAITLTVRDNGVGLPPDFDIRHTNSLGLYLVYNIAVRQLGGSLEVCREEGSKFTIQFRR